MYAVLLSSDIKHIHASLEALNFANHTVKERKGKPGWCVPVHFFLTVNCRGPFQPQPFWDSVTLLSVELIKTFSR